MTTENPGPKGDDTDDEAVPTYLWNYARNFDNIQLASDDLNRVMFDVLADVSMSLFEVSSRAKSIRSFQDKAKRTVKDDQTGVQRPKYSDPAAEIEDCVGARVILFTQSDVKDFVKQIRARFDIAREPHNPGDHNHDGYDSVHVVINGFADDAHAQRFKHLRDYLAGRRAEIQVRTVAGHAWAAYSHDVKYKATGNMYAALDDKSAKKRVDLLFFQAAGHREALDLAFDRINAIIKPATGVIAPVEPQSSAEVSDAEPDSVCVRPHESNTTEFELNADEFYAVLEEHYPEFDDDTHDEISAALGRIGALHLDGERFGFERIRSVDDLRTILDLCAEDSERVTSLMDYQSAPSRIRRFDDDMLALVKDRYLQTAARDHVRGPVFELRLRRLRGKRSIYRIDGPEDAPTTELTGAATLRALVNLVIERGELNSANIDAVVSDDPDEQFRGRYVVVETSHGSVNVNSNMNREWIDSCIRELIVRWRRLTDEEIDVTRGGDSIGT
ncbi:hypothetical protein ABLE94_04660 [Gordonia sp. VNK1]|uniref:hypothetical protein n=1 Tax=Gordonia oleivorans TaxID=3156618 RepID=UPI0032B3A81C